MPAAFSRDPDNNRLEVQIDNFATPAELDGYFHSRAFAENPVGVTYDPEELCRRYEACEAMADLLRILRGRPLGTCWRATDHLSTLLACGRTAAGRFGRTKRSRRASGLSG